jgi:hypothetical protein
MDHNDWNSIGIEGLCEIETRILAALLDIDHATDPHEEIVDATKGQGVRGREISAQNNSSIARRDLAIAVQIKKINASVRSIRR